MSPVRGGGGLDRNAKAGLITGRPRNVPARGLDRNMYKQYARQIEDNVPRTGD